ncbi:MAG: hypothetical protein RL748_608, partial [Pseudomonadota bacterium]
MQFASNGIARPTLLAALIAVSFGATSAIAAERVNLEKHASKALTANASLHQHLGLGANDLHAERNHKFANGSAVTRHVQMHQGVPVWNEVVVEHRDLTGAARVTGNLLRNLSNDLPSVKPVLSKADALAKAKTLAQIFNTENDHAKLYVKQNAAGVAHLVYVVSFNGVDTATPTRPFYMLDANTGAVIEQWNGIHTALTGTGPGGNAKTSQYEYGTNFGYNDVTQSGSTCSLNNTNVATYNMNSLSKTPSAPHSFTCPRNTVKAINGAYAPMNDAHFFGGVVFNM